MSAPAFPSLAEIEESERHVLNRIDARLEWMNREIADGAKNLRGLRDEVEITRISYEHQLALTRRLVELAVVRAERSDEVVEEAIEMMRSIRDALTGAQNGGDAGEQRAD